MEQPQPRMEADKSLSELGVEDQAGTGLAVSGLTRRFGSLVAVSDLSMHVQPGKILALLGPNGAGKTTTLLCLAGLLRPDAGRIAWQGKVLGPDRTRTMALIPETPEVYDMLTVWEHMVFVARSCKVDSGFPERAGGFPAGLHLVAKSGTPGQALAQVMARNMR